MCHFSQMLSQIPTGSSDGAVMVYVCAGVAELQCVVNTTVSWSSHCHQEYRSVRTLMVSHILQKFNSVLHNCADSYVEVMFNLKQRDVQCKFRANPTSTYLCTYSKYMLPCVFSSGRESDGWKESLPDSEYCKRTHQQTVGERRLVKNKTKKHLLIMCRITCSLIRGCLWL